MTDSITNIGITYQTDETKPLANNLAQQLNLPLVPFEDAKSFPLLLIVGPDKLAIHATQETYGAISIDFTSGSLGFRHNNNRAEHEMIVKALGVKPHYKPNVLDATGGLAQDAWLIASAGCNITVFERHPVLCALIDDALQHAAHDSTEQTQKTLAHFKLHCCDTIHTLKALTAADKFDVIYLDPMFPNRKKSALVKKEMQCLQLLLGDDHDSAELFYQARQHATKRVVVKRPLKAPTVSADKPNFCIKGKRIRFDVYVCG